MTKDPCECGALEADHLAVFEGRCYLLKSPRTLKLRGAVTLADAFKARRPSPGDAPVTKEGERG